MTLYTNYLLMYVIKAATIPIILQIIICTHCAALLRLKLGLIKPYSVYTQGRKWYNLTYLFSDAAHIRRIVASQAETLRQTMCRTKKVFEEMGCTWQPKPHSLTDHHKNYCSKESSAPSAKWSLGRPPKHADYLKVSHCRKIFKRVQGKKDIKQSQ